MDRAEELLKSKYGTAYHGFYISLYLETTSGPNANTSTAMTQCCKRSADDIQTGTIYFLAPGAPEWASSQYQTTSLGLPKDENYQAKVLMSEYITVGHYVVQNSRQAGGWRYYSAPEWFVQGLQEYDGIFHTTDANRTVTAAALMNWARDHAAEFSCCSQGIQFPDVYNGGAAFMAFLADRFGESIHAKLLLDGAPTFDDALAKETGMPVDKLFGAFQAWLAGSSRKN